MASLYGLDVVFYTLREKITDTVTYFHNADILSEVSLFLTMIRRPVRNFMLRPDVVTILFIILCLLIYHQYTRSWWKAVYRLRSALLLACGQDPGPDDSGLHSAQQKAASWDTRKGNVGVYAIQGRRQHMEDRYNLVNNFEQTGTSVYGIFDGHGGEFAADFVEKALFRNLMIRLLKMELLKTVETKNNIDEKRKSLKSKVHGESEESNEKFETPQYRETSPTEDCEGSSCDKAADKVAGEMADTGGEDIDDSEPSQSASEQTEGGDSYKDMSNNKSSSWDSVAKMLTEEILNVDRQLLNVARATNLISGTTALVAMLREDELTVANVGDSRGVICDQNGHTIPLSFDHKPQQVKERKRIKDAGGFISFNGVWRVAGVLATSRALGDYPLKERNLVIAEPDILTFDLAEMRPQFLILATDGLWDTFSNDEAVDYIKERLEEPHYGAKSIALQAYYRGSLDNITVMVVNFMRDDNGKTKKGRGQSRKKTGQL